jgi:hypothetical protein
MPDLELPNAQWSILPVATTMCCLKRLKRVLGSVWFQDLKNEQPQYANPKMREGREGSQCNTPPMKAPSDQLCFSRRRDPQR